jgi:hypothetical protein
VPVWSAVRHSRVRAVRLWVEDPGRMKGHAQMAAHGSLRCAAGFFPATMEPALRRVLSVGCRRLSWGSTHLFEFSGFSAQETIAPNVSHSSQYGRSLPPNLTPRGAPKRSSWQGHGRSIPQKSALVRVPEPDRSIRETASPWVPLQKGLLFGSGPNRWRFSGKMVAERMRPSRQKNPSDH